MVSVSVTPLLFSHGWLLDSLTLAPLTGLPVVALTTAILTFFPGSVSEMVNRSDTCSRHRCVAMALLSVLATSRYTPTGSGARFSESALSS